jgi:hypothetical protein
MRTIPIACAALLVALATAGASPDVHADFEPADSPSPSPTDSRECVVYSELSHRESRTLDVRLANTCAKPMTCSVAWTVTCGKAATVTRNGAVLAGAADRSWVASAASCEDDWSIDTSWSCKPSR